MADAAHFESASPLRDRVFRSLWVAALASNIGSGAHDLAAGWSMASLTRSELLVAALQTAVAVPSFVLCVPAGALADVVDRRNLLIWMQLASAVCAGLLAFMAWGDFLLYNQELDTYASWDAGDGTVRLVFQPRHWLDAWDKEGEPTPLYRAGLPVSSRLDEVV